MGTPAPVNPATPNSGAGKPANPYALAVPVKKTASAPAGTPAPVTGSAPKASNPYALAMPKPSAPVSTDPTSAAVNKVLKGGYKPSAPVIGAANQAKVLNFGQSVINAISMAGTFIEGYMQKAGEQSAAVAQGKQNLDFGAMLANDIAAGSKNATAWTRNEKTQYGQDVLESAGMPKDFGTVDVPVLGKLNIPGLALDIVTDPTNLIPGKVLTAPLKAVSIGAKTFIDAAKLAKIGQVSEKLAVAAKDTTEDVAKGAVKVEGATPQELKPGARALEQYTNKPLIEAKNVRPTGKMADALKNADAKVVSYKTVDTAGKVTTSQLIGSAIEAGAKATKAVLIGELANHELGTLAKQEVRVAKAAKKAAKKEPVATIDNVVTPIRAFEPHIAPDRTYVFDNNSIAHTFSTPEEATQWVQTQKDAPVVVNVTKGGTPVVDSGIVKPHNAVDALLMKLPTTNPQAKQAKIALESIDKIAKETTGTAIVDGATVEKKYTDFTALVHGLKTGDQVDYAALENIAKVFDPQAKLIKKIEKANKSGDAYTQLRDILVEKGPQTISDTAERLKLIDSGALLKAQGLAYADASAKYVEGRLTGALEPAAATSDAVRETAQANISSWMENPDTSKMLDDALNNISRGLSATFEKIQEIKDSPDFFQGISSLGDLAVRNTKRAYRANSKAILVKQLNQSGEARILGSVFGIMRKRTKNTQLDVQEFIHRMTMVNDSLLGVLGARTVYAKPEKLAKGNPHYIFLSMGDVASVLNETNPDLLKKAMFPNVGKATVKATDALSTISMGEAIRSIIEHRERNLPINVDSIAEGLQKRGELQTPWSAGYKAKVPAIAQELAQHLTDPAVIAEFEKIHTTRSLAAAEDSLRSAETISENLFDTMLKGWQANLDKGMDSVAARDQLVRNLFNEFVYASGIFKNQNGKIAESTFQAAAMMFLNGGRLEKLISGTDFVPLIGSPTSKSEVARQVYADAMKSINSFFKQRNADLFAAAGRERIPLPTNLMKAEATGKLTQAQLVYEQHMLKGQATGMTESEVATWNKEHSAIQQLLDDARLNAWKNSVPTFHYQNGEWVPSAMYSRSAAMSEAKAMIARSGAVTPAGRVADTIAKFPSYQKLTAAESEAFLVNWRKENNLRAIDDATAAADSAIKDVVDNAAEYENMGLTPAEQAQRMAQDAIVKPIDEYTIKVHASPNSYVPWNKFTNAEDTLRRQSEFSQRMNGTSGRTDLKPLLNQAESTIMNAVSNIADYAKALRTNYVKIFRDDAKRFNLSKEEALAYQSESFSRALKNAIARVEPALGETKVVSDLTYHLRAMFDVLFGNPETSAIVKGGIDPKMLASAFRKFGLSDKVGFANPGEMNPSQLADYLGWLPFADVPKDTNAIAKEGWAKRAKDFADSGSDPFVMVTRMAQAIQFARTEKGIVSDFASRFGYKAQGLTFEEAVRQGWVQIKGKSMGGTNLSDHLPSPEQGGLFPPHIAEQFMSINREWNKLYESGSMPRYIQTAMNIQGFMKVNQTIFNPRHHITNMFGDTSIAMIAGVLNPVHWGQGLELALLNAGDDVKAQWKSANFISNKLSGQTGTSLDAKFVQMYASWKGYDRSLEVTSKTGKRNPAITIYKNGKPTLVGLDQRELMQAFMDRGIMVSNIFQNDIQGLSDSVLSNSLSGDRASFAKIIGAKLHDGMMTIEKGPGSFAAYYGNIPRAAHALKIMQKRSWSSLEEALDAASAAVTMYHPTIQSLSASERRAPRIAFAYYTWIRVMHNAFIDMAMNHAGAMLVPSKIQYAQARANGMDPQDRGNPWSLDLQQATPSYLNYSTYGPTSTDASGPVLYKRSISAMDVLDNWNFSYDPAKTMDQNLFENSAKGLRVLGKSLNEVSQPIIEGLTGTDIQTGKPSTVKDLATFIDKESSNFALTPLLEALKVYTPSNKGATSSNPLTDNQRNIKLNNWLWGQKEQEVLTPGNLKNAQSERTTRLKTIEKNVGNKK